MSRATSMDVSFTERLGLGDRQYRSRWTPPAAPTGPAASSPEAAASYALCNVMYGTKRCSCQKGATVPCGHMSRGVEAVRAKLGAPQ